SCSDSGIGLLSSAISCQFTAEAESYVSHPTETKASNIIATAIGRVAGLLPGPLSKNGARSSPPNANPGNTRIPNSMNGPLAKSYFNNSYKNKKYQSGNGKYAASVGSAKPCKGAGAAIVTHKKPIKNTEPTNHSLSKKFGQNASVRPGYSE